MDFELTDDQRELQDVVRDVLSRECPPGVVRDVVEERSDGEDLWKTLVSLDWPGLAVAEVDGGTGLTAVELVIVLEELGRVADPTPFLATTSQFVPLVTECFTGAARRDVLAGVLAGVVGGRRGAAALQSSTRARATGDGWVLDGTATTVLDGDRADDLAVVASTGDGDVAVFLVDPPDAAVSRSTTFDGSVHLAEIVLDGVAVAEERAATGPHVASRVARATELAVTGLAATTVGACQRILDLTLDHIRQRHQFGVPIGSFQALKHMAVDVEVAIQRARILAHFAALTIAEDDPRRSVAASMAKAAAGDAQRISVRHGIQLFGGLGFTWENDLQLFVRRAMLGEHLLGTSADHRARVARSVLRPQPTDAAAEVPA